MKSKCNQSEITVNAKWNQSELKVKSTWTKSEIKVKSKWNHSELKVKSKWNQSPAPTPSPQSSYPASAGFMDIGGWGEWGLPGPSPRDREIVSFRSCVRWAVPSGNGPQISSAAFSLWPWEAFPFPFLGSVPFPLRNQSEIYEKIQYLKFQRIWR